MRVQERLQQRELARGDLAAGARCPFGLSGRVLVDKEQIRTTQVNPDGTPRQQQVVGRLEVRYVDAETGDSVDRNLTGNALIDTRDDGSMTIILLGGHVAVGLAATDPGGPAYCARSDPSASLGATVTFSRRVSSREQRTKREDAP